MDTAATTFLLNLLDTPSPSGFEADGQRLWGEYLQPYVDAVDSDAYGNTWGLLQGAGSSAPVLMLEAHADEIGFMVNHVTEQGFLHITRIGGSDRSILRGRRVRILGRSGVVRGVLANTAIHLRDSKDDKHPEWHDLVIDIGAANREEVESRGVRVGHAAVVDEGAEELWPGRLVGRALDNRIGGVIVAEVMRRLAASSSRPAWTVYAVNSVQEEIGGHGAKMVAYRIAPQAALVLDVTHATDTPGITAAKHGEVKLGEGPTLTHGSANHVRIVERLEQVAAGNDIPVQHEASSRFTGTDTDDIYVSRAGVPSALVSLPMRYMHSPVEMVDLADVERLIDLLTAFVLDLKADDAFGVVERG